MIAPAYYAWFDATGKILRYVFCLPAEREMNDMPGHDWVEVASEPDPDRHYIAGGELTLRPAQASTISGLVLSNLPDPCEIVIEGSRYTVTGGTATLSFGLPGTYAVRVEAFPFLPADFEVAYP